MTPSENRRKDLLDDFFLTNDDFVELLFHHLAVLAEFLKYITEATLFSRHTILVESGMLVSNSTVKIRTVVLL